MAKILYSDFQKKTHKEYISNTEYFTLLKKHFSPYINKLLKSDIKKEYIDKYFKNFEFAPTEEQIKNFRENIYYPDFLVFYDLAYIRGRQFKKDNLINIVRMKETMFGYLLFRHINGYDKEIENMYLEGIGLYAPIDLKVENYYKEFIKYYPGFLDIFADAKQNIKFVDIVKKHLKKYTIKNFYIYDNMRALSYYNKRLFKI